MLRSLLTKAYWSRSCTVDPAYGWFLEKLKAAVDRARLKYGSDEVCIRDDRFFMFRVFCAVHGL